MRGTSQVSRHGFTLVEVMAVVAVIGVIVGITLPTLSTFRAEAHSTVCLSNLRQIFTALDTARQLQQDTLPYAAPLPVPTTQIAVVPGLPEKLKGIMPRDNPVWMCPDDNSDDSQLIGTSYIYVAGAFLTLEPPLINFQSGEMESNIAREARVCRLITQRYTTGYLKKIALVADNDDYHDVGNRIPRNGVFITGDARVIKPDDVIEGAKPQE